MLMKSDLLKLGSDRILIDENGILYRLSLTEPDTDGVVSVFDYEYPGSGWENLSGKTVTYFKYIVFDELCFERAVKTSTGDIIEFYTLQFYNANEQCEYHFALVDASCIARSPSYLVKESHAFVREWQTKVIEDRCTVVAETE